MGGHLAPVLIVGGHQLRVALVELGERLHPGHAGVAAEGAVEQDAAQPASGLDHVGRGPPQQRVVEEPLEVGAVRLAEDQRRRVGPELVIEDVDALHERRQDRVPDGACQLGLDRR